MGPVIIGGLSIGAMYALVGLGLVVEYRFSKVLNLAHGGQALLAAYVFNSHRDKGIYLAMAMGIAASALVGLAIEYVAVERLRRSPPLVKMMITIAFLLLILGVTGDIYGSSARFTPVLFTNSTFKVLGVVVAGDQMVMMILMVLITAGLTIFFRTSNLGIMMRAAGERPILSQTLGIDSTLMGRVIWLLGGALAGLAGILLTPLVNLDPVVYTLLVVAAYTAVLIGRMEDILLTVIGGLALGMVQSWAAYEFQLFGIRELVAFIAALAALIVGSKQLEAAETKEAM